MDRWLWICPWIGLAGAIAALWIFGLSLLSALGIAFLLSCPAVIVWSLRESRRVFGLRDRLLDALSRREGRP